LNADQVIHIAASLRGSCITMHAGIGEVGAASDDASTIDDHKLVVHQTTAFAAVFGVINPSNSVRFEG